MVYRVYVEKKPGLRHSADSLKEEIRAFLGIKELTDLRLFNRYDVEGIDKELFDYAVGTVFSEPQQDETYAELPEADAAVFAVEYLPGQYDQRADSAAQCIQIISQGNRPAVRNARVYMLFGDLTAQQVAEIRKYVINPVESREASLELPETLDIKYDIPASVATLEGFTKLDEEGLKQFMKDYGLAMDLGDITCCRDYFLSEQRDPTITEIKVIDTYWSDHCRHTTFNTIIDKVEFEDELLQKAYEEYIAVRKEIGRTKPVTLMDMGTIAVKYLRANGGLQKLDESEEINACTVKMKVEIDGEEQDWLLLFKNETHNHPTEIEPFGGAATCIGGAIRDPLSGRSYVYAAMRVTGAADPLAPVEDTLKGKLPQRKIVTTAAAGYSSYGNQIGLATGQVDELYHAGYAAKRMEIGAVVAAAPAENVRRERPEPGDVILLLGGRTGRDGCGGATGSSKSHTVESLETCGAEVQKGNAPEERKLQRLFRRGEATKLIKRCNDFGAGGVSVSVGELCDGLDIDLNAVPKKYDGLDGTELAISESQERMSVVVEAKDEAEFCRLAAEENLEVTRIAVVKADRRLTMTWNGATICDISRDFLDTNGAEKHITAAPAAPEAWGKEIPAGFAAGMNALASDLNVCSKRGLGERFDSTIGANTVLMPFGGKYQHTPIQAMVHKVAVEQQHTKTCSVMSWGYNPYIAEKSPYHSAFLAVVESVAKLVAVGAKFEDVYLSLQEYFERLGSDPKRWGKPLAALLGAFMAQKQLKVAAIGGKDSMSGSFEQLDVPPTLVSFAITTEDIDHIVSNEFKAAGHKVVLLKPEYDAEGLPVIDSLVQVFDKVFALTSTGKAVAAYTPTFGGETVCLNELLAVYEGKLEPIYPCNIPMEAKEIPTFNYEAASYPAPAIKIAKPKAIIPVFPGTNCEFDTAKALCDAGADPEIIVIKNLTADAITESVEYFAKAIKQSQIVFIPGGFSGGDEPDGSAKFITAFFRNAQIKDAVHELLKNRDGLMGGICNGFQALIKLGLVPYGEIIDADDKCPTLTFNTIGRHQSRIVRTRIASNKSPWLAATKPGDVYNVAISHGEGRFIAPEGLILDLAANGQIATQYVGLDGVPTNDVNYNPNNSAFAIEGITSPDGRVFGKMGHSERKGYGMYKNVPGEYDMKMFESAVKYFK